MSQACVIDAHAMAREDATAPARRCRRAAARELTFDFRHHRVEQRVVVPKQQDLRIRAVLGLRQQVGRDERGFAPASAITALPKGPRACRSRTVSATAACRLASVT
jgi:hypothetical protein